MSKNYVFLYLHGFTSSPNSRKARFLYNKLKSLGHEIIIPDMNAPEFSSLTLTRQLEQISAILDNCTKEVVLLGSSMGGLTATILAERYKHIIKMILLAPAFKIATVFSNAAPKNKLLEWQDKGEGLVYHSAYAKEVPLKFSFYTDLVQYNDHNFNRQIPTLVFHGIDDEIVPVEYSRSYILLNTQAQMFELQDDHSLDKNLDFIWKEICKFCFG